MNVVSILPEIIMSILQNQNIKKNYFNILNTGNMGQGQNGKHIGNQVNENTNHSFNSKTNDVTKTNDVIKETHRGDFENEKNSKKENHEIKFINGEKNMKNEIKTDVYDNILNLTGSEVVKNASPY